MRTAVYPGSFDPITNGHVDLIERAIRIFDRLIVAVAEHADKSPLFTMEERVEMVREIAKKYDRITVDQISGLTVDYVRGQGASVIVRGLRAISDFEFELQMALMNRKLDSEIETVFLMPSIQYSYIKSSLVKEVARLGGCLDGLVPDIVIHKLREKFACLGSPSQALESPRTRGSEQRRKTGSSAPVARNSDADCIETQNRES